MTTTDANGILFFEETDPVSPLHTLLNTAQTATSLALKRTARGPRYASNNSERDALLLQYGSSPTEPLWVDLAGTLMRHDGTAWRAFGAETYVNAVGGTGPVTGETLITARNLPGLGYRYRAVVSAQVRVDLAGGAADYVLEIRHAAPGALATAPTTLDRCEVRQTGGTLRCQGIYESATGASRDFGMYLARSGGAGTGSVTGASSVNRLDIVAGSY